MLVEQAHRAAPQLSASRRAAWSQACLRTTPSVPLTACLVEGVEPRASRVCAQSIVSAIDGAFFSSSVRSARAVLDQLLRQLRAAAPGTRD